MKVPVSAIALATAVVFSPMTQAAVVFNNGAPDLVNGNEMTEWVQAENFSVGSATTITSVQFWADTAARTDYAGSITYSIYANNAGVPGTVLATGSVTPALVATGRTASFGDAEYVLNFNLLSGFNAAAGTTYWLGLHNGPITNNARAEFYWGTTNPGNPPAGEEEILPGTVWDSNGQEHAFELFNNAGVPEPAVFTMVGIGLGLLGLLRFRTR